MVRVGAVGALVLAGCLVSPDHGLIEEGGVIDGPAGAEASPDRGSSDVDGTVADGAMTDVSTDDGPSPVPPPRLKSVRSGSGSIADGSSAATLTISPVLLDLTRTVLWYQIGSNTSNPQDGAVRCLLQSTSTISCDRVGTAGAVSIQWYAAEFQNGVKVQHLQPTCDPSGLTQATIAAVDVQRTFLLFGARRSGVTFSDDDYNTVTLTGPTTVEIERGEAGCSSDAYAIQVVEMDSVKVTRGVSSSMTGASLSVAGQPPVDLQRTFLLYTWRVTATGNTICDRMVRGRLDAATSIRFHRGAGASGCGAATVDSIAWQRVELWNGAAVQQVTATAADGEGTREITLPQAVDTSRTVVFAGGQGESGQAMGEGSFATDDIIGTMSGRLLLTGGTTIEVKRDNTGGQARWTAYALEL